MRAADTRGAYRDSNAGPRVYPDSANDWNSDAVRSAAWTGRRRLPANTRSDTNMDTCNHAVRWTRNADTGHFTCSDCGAAITVSKPQYTDAHIGPGRELRTDKPADLVHAVPARRRSPRHVRD